MGLNWWFICGWSLYRRMSCNKLHASSGSPSAQLCYYGAQNVQKMKNNSPNQHSFTAYFNPPRGTSSLKNQKPGVLWSVAWGMSRQADSRRCLNSPIIVQQLTWPPSVVGPMEPRRGELGVRRVPNNLLHSLSEQLEAPVRGDSCQSQVLFANVRRSSKK